MKKYIGIRHVLKDGNVTSTNLNIVFEEMEDGNFKSNRKYKEILTKEQIQSDLEKGYLKEYLGVTMRTRLYQEIIPSNDISVNPRECTFSYKINKLKK